MKITYTPIGTIHTPFHELSGMPIQPASDLSAPGTVELLPEYVPGIKDLDGFSHIILIYHLHQSHGFKLMVKPFLDTESHGVFSTRAPLRPNPIGISVVKLLGVEHNLLRVDNLDVLDGTPLLDIKPYIPEFDSPPAVRLGWLEGVKYNLRSTRSDQRFL